MHTILRGRLAFGTVHGAIATLYRRFPPESVVVVRCIDSEHRAPNMQLILQRHQIDCHEFHGNVCTSLNDLSSAIDRAVFNGFDEVWILKSCERLSNLSALPAATSDGMDFSTAIPEQILATFSDLDGILAVADGCGLNYCTSSREIAEVLLSLFDESAQ